MTGLDSTIGMAGAEIGILIGPTLIEEEMFVQWST